VNTRKGEREKDGRFTAGEREGEVITVDAGIAVCGVDAMTSLLLWHHAGDAAL